MLQPDVHPADRDAQLQLEEFLEQAAARAAAAALAAAQAEAEANKEEHGPEPTGTSGPS